MVISLVCLAGQQKTAVLLTLASIAGVSPAGADSHHQQQYVSWLWDLLLSQTGKLLVQLDTATVLNYVALCKKEVTAPLVWCCVDLEHQRHVHKTQEVSLLLIAVHKQRTL